MTDVATPIQTDESDVAVQLQSASTEEKEVKIAKTEALKKYLLREKDLVGLQYDTHVGKKYGKKIVMKLFLESDILARAILRWGSEDGLEHERLKRDSRKLKTVEKKEQVKTDRRQELIDELKKVGLELRSDSKLCNGFIHGTLDKDWTMAEIVDMCQMMNWLHTSTDYQKRLDKFFKKHKEEQHYRYETGDRDYYDRNDEKEDIECQIDSIRRDVIKKHGGGTPWRESKLK